MQGPLNQGSLKQPMGPLNQCKGLCDRWNTDPSFTVWGPMQLSHLSWVIHLQWISPLSSSLQEHKEEEKTSNFHGSSQPTRAVPGQRHVCTIFIRCRAGWCVVRPHATSHNHSTTNIHQDRSPIFHTGNGQRVPGSGQPGTFQCDKSPEEEQLFFALLIRSASLLVQTASNSFTKTWVSPQ